MATATPTPAPSRHRPRAATVFVAAFVAGAAAAVGVNRVLDVHLAQAKPQVECEPIFVALRPLPQGAPVTVWDVALRDWPKAMLPSTAMRVSDSFAGRMLKYPLREGQPLLGIQLAAVEVAPPTRIEGPAGDSQSQDDLVDEVFVAPVPAVEPVAGSEPTPLPTSETSVPAQPNPVVERVAEQIIETAVDTVASEPAPSESQPTIAAEESLEVVSTEVVSTEVVSTEVVSTDIEAAPTIAAEPVVTTPRMATVPRESAPPITSQPEVPLRAIGEGQSFAGLHSDLDMTSQPAVNLADIPSVMARGDAGDAPTVDGEGHAGVRYLVVPERIARQADTSFTTPVAPEAAPSGPMPQANRPASAAQQPQASARQQPQASARQQSKPRPSGEAKPVGQSSSVAGSRPQPSPRAWGGMFPNVSAGLEAMGSWRSRGREEAAQSPPTGSTTR